nr:hypothetical protein [Enterovibrio coralii]
MHEPGTTLEALINKEAFDKLPKDLQAIVLAATRVANADMLAEYTARNNAALESLINEHNVELRPYPKQVLTELQTLADEVVAEQAEVDAISKKVYDSYKSFRDQAVDWHAISEQAMLNARNPQ